MELLNRLGIPATAMPGMAADGTPLTVLVAKATFQIPPNGQAAQLASEQVPIVEADEFEAEPGLSPPRYEAELVPHKPRCEVLLLGAAHARSNRPAHHVVVGLRVGALKKAFQVTGTRHWQKPRRRGGAWRLSEPEPFVQQRLSYSTAYGGADTSHADTRAHAVWHANPLGQGFHSNRDDGAAHNKPAAQTQLIDTPPTAPWQPQASLSFGPIGRSWQPRLQLAGTFDLAWREERFPLLPQDFNPLHWQAAPADQQLDALEPGLPLELWNLTPDGHCSFELPALALQARCTRAASTTTQLLRADTLLIEPEQGRFSLTWRTHWRLLRSPGRSLGPIERLELRHA